LARADLHVHTSASDGVNAPAEVVAMAVRAGLAAIGIADHDTTDGIDEAEQAAAAIAAGGGPSLEVLPAVEINTDEGPFEAHVLGYFIDRCHGGLRGLLSRQREMRLGRARRMVARLAEIGMPVEWERVATIAGRATLTRPHIAAALVERGHVRDVGEAMRGVLARGGAAYVARDKLTPQEAVLAIRAAGGVAVLAHPGTVGRDSLIDELVEVGLAGLEVRHPLHTPEQERRYQTMARRRHLVQTGGTDYHGFAEGRTAAGYGHGSFAARPGELWVGIEVVEELRRRRQPTGAPAR
jgi:predicted metal-dependent phosphoesterase TrpH